MSSYCASCKEETPNHKTETANTYQRLVTRSCKACGYVKSIRVKPLRPATPILHVTLEDILNA
jgi:uncharacterized Zn finger protein